MRVASPTKRPQSLRAMFEVAGGDLAVTAVDEIVEGVSGGWLVVTLFDLTQADVIDDEQWWCGPSPEPTSVRAVGQSSVQVVEEIDTAGIAHVNSLLACAECKSLEDVTLAGPALTGDDEVVVAAHEVESKSSSTNALSSVGWKFQSKASSAFRYTNRSCGRGA